MSKYDCSLWDLLKSKGASEIGIKERIEILLAILEAVIFIQSKEVCHLDIKPSNVMLRLLPNGHWDTKNLVLSDFGLSISVYKKAGNAGTPGYGAPEQFLGRPHRKSDNYSVGKIGVMTLFPWTSAWNFLAQPIPEGEESPFETKEFELLKSFHKQIAALLHVSYFLFPLANFG